MNQSWLFLTWKFSVKKLRTKLTVDCEVMWLSPVWSLTCSTSSRTEWRSWSDEGSLIDGRRPEKMKTFGWVLKSILVIFKFFSVGFSNRNEVFETKFTWRCTALPVQIRPGLIRWVCQADSIRTFGRPRTVRNAASESGWWQRGGSLLARLRGSRRPRTSWPGGVGFLNLRALIVKQEKKINFVEAFFVLFIYLASIYENRLWKQKMLLRFTTVLSDTQCFFCQFYNYNFISKR